MSSLKIPDARTLKLALIALPVALAALYFFVFASDRYVSESTVALQRAGNDGAAAVPGAAMLLAGLNPLSREETLYLRQYVHSIGLLQELDAKLGLRKHFGTPGWDFALRLRAGASQEDFVEYYRSRVEVSMDELSSTLTVRAQGFDAAFAKQLNEAILRESERFVNEMSHKLAREQLGFAESELVRTGKALESARAEVLAFQAKNRLLDPTVQAQASGALVAQMQATLSRQQTELQALRSFLNDDAYQVKALKAQIQATEAQLNAERARATGTGQRSDRLGALAIEFQALQSKAEFALDAYKLALSAVEAARIDTTRKIKSLVVIEPPTLPQTAEYPRRLYNLASLLIACLLLYGVARLVIATIREHQD
jgi:capsular polysaccharide transport system permease protein